MKLIHSPTLRDGAQEFMVWLYDNKGVHSVKSAYKLYIQLKKTRRDGGAGASSMVPGNLNSTSDDSWKRIWMLPCPINIQMFTWRLKHESLALRTTVAWRGTPIADTKCLFCSRADEVGAHLFIKCKVAKEVWRDLVPEKERNELEKIEGVHAMLDYIWGLDEKKRLHILTFWWLWWANRNKAREGELPFPPAEVARRTKSNVLEYLQIFCMKADRMTLDKWRPRLMKFIKLMLMALLCRGNNMQVGAS